MIFAAFLIAISCIFGLIGYGLAKFFFGLTIGWFMKVLLWIFVFLLVFRNSMAGKDLLLQCIHVFIKDQTVV